MLHWYMGMSDIDMAAADTAMRIAAALFPATHLTTFQAERCPTIRVVVLQNHSTHLD
jgi:hypothetical protein